jgi:hypothetical protein
MRALGKAGHHLNAEMRAIDDAWVDDRSVAAA